MNLESRLNHIRSRPARVLAKALVLLLTLQVGALKTQAFFRLRMRGKAALRRRLAPAQMPSAAGRPDASSSAPARRAEAYSVQDLLDELAPLPNISSRQARAWVPSLVEDYWLAHPRARYVKTRPVRARLLDAGAGPGGLAHWLKAGIASDRSDIVPYALDQTKGEFFDQYAEYRIGDLNSGNLQYPSGFFDAILMSHVLEHLARKDQALRALAAVLKPGGTLYVEIPSPHTAQLPKSDAFKAAGFPGVIFNFFEDPTHVGTLSNADLREQLVRHGFEIEESGEIANPGLDLALLAVGRAAQHEDLCLFGLWLRTRWAHYAVARKPL